VQPPDSEINLPIPSVHLNLAELGRAMSIMPALMSMTPLAAVGLSTPTSVVLCNVSGELDSFTLLAKSLSRHDHSGSYAALPVRLSLGAAHEAS
jgi:hypothetical protein